MTEDLNRHWYKVSTANDPGYDTEVNLEAWLRGLVKYQPHVLRPVASERFGKRYTKLYLDLVIDCIKAKLVPEEEVCEELRGYLTKSAT